MDITSNITGAGSARDMQEARATRERKEQATEEASSFSSMMEELRNQAGSQEEERAEPAPVGTADPAQALAGYLPPAGLAQMMPVQFQPVDTVQADSDAMDEPPDQKAAAAAPQAAGHQDAADAAVRQDSTRQADRADRAGAARAQAEAVADPSASGFGEALRAAGGEPVAAGLAAAEAPLPLPDTTLTGPALAGAPGASTQPNIQSATQLPPAPTVAVAAPPASPAFAGEVTESLRLLAGKGIQAAELRLTPDELGAVDVRIQIRDGRADVSLLARTPEAQAALQQALPRLAESLAAAGLTLGETSVGQQNREPAGDRESGGRAFRHPLMGTGQDSATAGPGLHGSGPTASATRRGLIDLYA
jgi:flagellar hook-length control protein FliK